MVKITDERRSALLRKFASKRTHLDVEYAGRYHWIVSRSLILINGGGIFAVHEYMSHQTQHIAMYISLLVYGIGMIVGLTSTVISMESFYRWGSYWEAKYLEEDEGVLAGRKFAADSASKALEVAFMIPTILFVVATFIVCYGLYQNLK